MLLRPEIPSLIRWVECFASLSKVEAWSQEVRRTAQRHGDSWWENMSTSLRRTEIMAQTHISTVPRIMHVSSIKVVVFWSYWQVIVRFHLRIQVEQLLGVVRLAHVRLACLSATQEGCRTILRCWTHISRDRICRVEGLLGGLCLFICIWLYTTAKH